MGRAIGIGAQALRLAAGMAVLTAGAVPGRAEVTVTETPDRVVLENESVRLVFATGINSVPAELVDKRGGGQNLIVDNFCLYYQFIEDGEIRSVNEGYPGGRISDGRSGVERKDGGATVEFRCDTPHFHLTRRVTVPAAGPEVKFLYELECKEADSFGFSLPYAPLSPRLNRSAEYLEFIGKDGRKEERLRVGEVKAPVLHTGPPYDRTECYFDDRTGEGLVFAHLREECASGIGERDKFRFDAGMKERCVFVVVPFQGDLIARAETLLRRAEGIGGDYRSSGGEYFFDGYLQEPIELLALRHDVAETVEALGKAIPAKE